VVLDRDGTIIVERNYLSTPDDVELIPSAINGLRLLQESGFGLVVVTNQSGIGRGFFTVGRLQEIHVRMMELLGEHKITIDGIYHCPHHPRDSCACRKPRPLLVTRAANELGFEPSSSYYIGDKMCDIQLGKDLGGTSLLVRTGHGESADDRCHSVADYVAKDLGAAAEIIIGQARS
jgi:D-glycero-D-manno-heptose 1,7-bisphosphate phosphatase